MATKRSFSDIHPSRRDQVASTSRKRQKPDNLGPKSFKKAHPTNDLKTRIRNLTRLLARDDDNLPANIRIAKERELQTLQYDLEETQTAERKSKLISRYHKIRFFDRQKASKKLRKATKLLKALGDDVSPQDLRARQSEVEEAELDLNYTMYYPLDKPYNALFPKDERETKSGGDEEDIEPQNEVRGDPEMRKLVRECMMNGKLAALRNGQLTNAVPIMKDERNQPTKRRARDAESKHQRTTAGDDSDGGFFE